MEIRESQIEDILINSPALAQRILFLEDEPKLEYSPEEVLQYFIVIN
jgi:hypothetical protein